MDLDPKCIFVQRERNLDVHHPVINLVASLARNRGVTFTEIHCMTMLVHELWHIAGDTISAMER